VPPIMFDNRHTRRHVNRDLLAFIQHGQRKVA
jgi:hypothetical protein